MIDLLAVVALLAAFAFYVFKRRPAWLIRLTVLYIIIFAFALSVAVGVQYTYFDQYKPALTNDNKLIEWWLDETSQVSKAMNKSDAIEKALRHFFKPKLNSKQRKMLLETAKICLKVAEQAGLSPFLMATNLLGYYRHNKSLSPFDEDFDVALPVSNYGQLHDWRDRFLRLLKTHPTHTGFYSYLQARFKCYSRHEEGCYKQFTDFKGNKWCWPFTDMQFFMLNTYYDEGIQKTGFTDMAAPSTSVPVERLYPPKRITYSELKIPVFIPHNIFSLLPPDLDICRNKPQYNHMLDKWDDHVVWVKCDAIKHFVDFVYANETDEK